MSKWFLTLTIIAMLLPGGFRIEHCEVTQVEKGIVTMTGTDGDYWLPEDESWQEGDKALVLVKRGKVIEARYKWR